MAVIRQQNWLGQQRCDIPHFRALEASIAADFDLLAGQIMAGKNALVVNGFALGAGSAGIAATSLQVQVAGSVLMHPEASESGTIFQVPMARPPETLNASNARVSGGFTANAINYIGVDLRRTADASTADLVQFLDADTNLENPKTVPLGRTLDYVIVISTQDFSTTPGVAPIAKVTTDAFNNIASSGIEDARNLMFRLGTGGAITNWKHQYPWPTGRGEPGAVPNSDFSSGDKSITSLKDWMNAAMTRLWELGGGEYWYSATADRNVKLMRAGTTFSNGDWFSWDGTNLLWKGLTILFDNSNGVYNVVADQTSTLSGLTNLLDGDCIYVDLDRTQSRGSGNPVQPVKAQLSTLGVPTVPGARLVLAWRRGSGTQCIVTRDAQFPVNATFTVATTVNTGVVQLYSTPGSSTAPLVFVADTNNALTVAATAGNAAGVTGTGNGSGAGLRGVGGASGAGASLTGGSTGTALQLTGTTNNSAAQVIYTDAGGRRQFHLGALGLHVNVNPFTVREDWLANLGAGTGTTGPVANNPRWKIAGSYTGTGGNVVSLDPSVTTSPFVHAGINLPCSPLSNAPLLTTSLPAFKVDTVNALISMEWFVSVTANDTADWFAGISTNNDYITDANNYIAFRAFNRGTQWYAVTRSGGVETATALTGAVSGVAKKFRIEIVGSGTGVAGAATVRFYLNDAVVATTTTNIPSGYGWPCFGGIASNNGTFNAMYLGPVTWAANYFNLPGV